MQQKSAPRTFRLLHVIIIAGLAFGLGVGAGVVGLLWATGGTGEPSAAIDEVAPRLSLDEPTDQPAETPEATPETAETPVDEATEAAASNPPLEARRALFRIQPEESEARFLIDEVLAGNPTKVVGSTKDVGGDLIINFADPSASEIGTLLINARTIRTDNDFRNQAIRGRILRSSQDQYEFITFVPTQLLGLPNTPVAVGDMLDFQIVGDLTVLNTTRSVTFDASVTLASDTRIEGSAKTTVLWADFGIVIQAPPTVTDIGQEVGLEIDLAAIEVTE